MSAGHDGKAHDALLCVLTGKLVSDVKRPCAIRHRIHQRVEEEWGGCSPTISSLRWLARAIANHRCGGQTKWKAYDILGVEQMPRFPSRLGNTARELSARGCSEQGLRQRSGLARFNRRALCMAAAGLELQVMEQMGFPTYFLGGLGLHAANARESKASRWARAWLGGRPPWWLTPGMHGAGIRCEHGLLSSASSTRSAQSNA